jgi:ribonucleoside-diphosphate reductase alpha chain
VFRELAVSYLERFDLAHVDPSESGFDALGKGEAEGKAPATQYVSRGLTRSRTDKLGIVAPQPSAEARGVASSHEPQGSGSAKVTALHATGAVALKAEPEQKLSPAQALEHLNWQEAKPTAKEKRLEAKAKGYEGDPCGECQNYTLVRNGTCMKCDTCGSTTGCS